MPSNVHDNHYVKRERDRVCVDAFQIRSKSVEGNGAAEDEINNYFLMTLIVVDSAVHLRNYNNVKYERAYIYIISYGCTCTSVNVCVCVCVCVTGREKHGPNNNSNNYYNYRPTQLYVGRHIYSVPHEQKVS